MPTKTFTLVNMTKGQQARILEILGGKGVRQHLAGLGIHPGDQITMIQNAPSPGPFLVEVHSFRVALGRVIAAKIVVDDK